MGGGARTTSAVCGPRGTRALALAAAATVATGCASSKTAPPLPAGPPAPLEAPRASADDVVVARVNGRPVWGSCVADQAARGATRQAALDQCVGFELMAQAAEQRGLALDRDVALATRTAMVSQLVAHEFEDKLDRPEDLGSSWTQLRAKNLWRFRHGEFRGSAYARVPLAPEKPHTPEEEAAAHQLADEIAAAARGEVGMFDADLFDLARRVAGTRTIETAIVGQYKATGLESHYADALFAIPEVGRTAPEAVRTKWGWDVILWTSVVPARDATDEEIVAELLPDVKRLYFSTWVNRIARDLGTHAEIVQKNLPLLEALP